MYRSIAKKQMKRVVFNYLIVAVFTVLTALTSCGGKSTMKDTTYFNSNPEKTPMAFMTKTVGVLEFVDNKKVEICFPYAIDTENMKGNIGVSSELWVPGEYKRVGNAITVHFKLSKDQKEPVVLEFQVKDEGKFLLGEQSERFDKIDRPSKSKK